KVPDRAVARLKPAQQPHHLDVATCLALEPPRGADLIEVAIQIQLQEIGRMVGRLACSATTIRMREAQLGQIKGAHIRIYRSNRVVRTDIVIHSRRQQHSLLATVPSLECAIRHVTNRTPLGAAAYGILAQSLSIIRHPSFVRRIGGLRYANPPYDI